MNRPTEKAIGQAFYEILEQGIGRRTTFGVMLWIENRAREIDAAAPAVVVTDEMVERAITAAMRECRHEGVAMSDKRWDTIFPSRESWRAALAAAFTDLSE